jgi:formate dehydrogenase major subunit
MREVETTCPYCGTGCSLVLQVEENKIVNVVPAKGNSVNQGRLCSKGHFGMDFVHSPERLTEPLVRRDGVLQPASWDEAYDLIAERFEAYKETFGPMSIAGFSSARCSNEENYLMQKLMRAGVGTNSVDHCARL